MIPWDLYGRLAAFGMPPRRPSARPDISELLDPLPEEIDYPVAPTPFTRARDLAREDRRGLTMEQLANIAAAIGGSDPGYLGEGLARAAGANLDSERRAVDLANARQAEGYARQRKEAEAAAQRRQAQAARQREEEELRALLDQGDRAIALAGGEEADPSFAERVYSAVRTRNASGIAGLVADAPARAAMRARGLDPDDALAIEQFRAEQALEAKKREEAELGPLRSERELADYRRRQEIEEEFEDPPAPVKPNWITNFEGGFRYNEDTDVWQPLPADLPRPRDAKAFDEIEKLAVAKADRDERLYHESANLPTYQNKNPSWPNYTKNPALAGKAVPFDYVRAYEGHERRLRQIANRKQAEADPRLGTRGPASAPAPNGPGGPPSLRQQQGGRSVEQKLRDIEAAIGRPLPARLRAQAKGDLEGGALPRTVLEELLRDAPFLRKEGQ